MILKNVSNNLSLILTNATLDAISVAKVSCSNNKLYINK